MRLPLVLYSVLSLGVLAAPILLIVRSVAALRPLSALDLAGITMLLGGAALACVGAAAIYAGAVRSKPKAASILAAFGGLLLALGIGWLFGLPAFSVSG